ADPWGRSLGQSSVSLALARPPALRWARLQHAGEDVRMSGLAEVEPLHLVAAALAQEALLLGRLDALGDDRDAERAAHRDDGLGDRLILEVLRNLTNERAVDLQCVDRKALELSERRVARAE